MTTRNPAAPATPPAGAAAPGDRLPEWVRYDLRRIGAVLDRRAGGSGTARLLWDAVHALALKLDSLAACPADPFGTADEAYGTACWLLARLLPEDGELTPADLPATSRAGQARWAAWALFAAFDAPEGEEPGPLLAGATAVIAAIARVLVTWDENLAGTPGLSLVRPAESAADPGEEDPAS